MALADVFRLFYDDGSPVGFRAYDGSVVERSGGAAMIEVRSPRALRYLVSAPGQLGLARAYVTGTIDARGDLHAALAHARAVRSVEVARVLARSLPGALGFPLVPAAPAEEVPARWRRGLAAHSRRRDAVAIAHHYDLSNRFYELVLGPSMAYSCAVFADPGAALEEAQAEKFDLICRKLDLQPGQRLLDVGAGWGGMVMHAAANYGVRAVGVTLSRRQADWARQAIAGAGLARRAEVRTLDYRDLGDERFDAVSSIGAMEHFGTHRLGSYFASIASRLRPGGRMLNHSITRPSNCQRNRAGPFIDRYIFPDGELQGLGTIVGAMHDNGLEVRHDENLREHYALTLAGWRANLERQWSAAVTEVGEQRARAWRLYLAAARIEFERRTLEIHQLLGVRPGAAGRSGMPLRPDWSARDDDVGAPRVHAAAS